jgi:hypothetical protein
MKYHFPLLLVLAIAGCNSPTERSVSEQPQVTEGTPEPALVQKKEPSPEQTPVQNPTPAASAGNCDRAYPDVCIAPPPPDLDCKDVPHQNFRVLPPDPHRFDGKDKDGIGCESNR